MSKPFQYTSGPKDARIIFVGEAWGKEEEKLEQPFIGASGQELTRMCQDAAVNRFECLLTNVLALRPPENNIEYLCVSRKDVSKEYSHAPIRQGKYLQEQYLPELKRLYDEIMAVNPNLVVALGNTACWALLGSGRISSIRGVATESTLCPGIKVLPTYHPSAVLRNWALRTIVVMDLMKAKREGQFPDIRRPERTVIVNPTAADIDKWMDRPFHTLAVDIETTFRQIRMIGFACSASDALVIPFVDMSKPGNNYWQSTEEELYAWKQVKYLIESYPVKIFQNGLFDLQFILRMGFKPQNCTEDTMLLHHSLFPELQKGLGFLGSIYTNESSWKLMRSQDTLKRDE